MAEERAVCSPDGRRWWGCDGELTGFSCSDRHDDVVRLVVGRPGTNALQNAATDIADMLRNVQASFPALTHLHVWGSDSVQQVGGLPQSLKFLDLRGCSQLRTIAALPKAAQLQTLDLEGCRLLSELPAADYSKLECAYLGEIEAKLTFAPLCVALEFQGKAGPLRELQLHGSRFHEFEASECGSRKENVAEKIRQLFRARNEQGQEPWLECKVIVLGNGGVGKTELIRALRGEPFDPDQEATHAIRLWKWDGQTDGDGFRLYPDELPNTELHLNIWDFGGQDLYHNTHRLFMETSAVFVIVERARDPDQPYRSEHPDDLVRPLQFWLDQVRAVTASDSRPPRVLIVRSAIDKTDTENGQPPKSWHWQPWRERVRTEDHRVRYFELSACDAHRSTDQWKDFRAHLMDLVKTELGGSAAVQWPRGRVAVRRKLQGWQPEWNAQRELQEIEDDKPILLRHEYDDLVRSLFAEQGIDESCADARELAEQLDSFHQRGILYAPKDWMQRQISPGAFPVVVDQRAIIEGIYELIRTPELREQLYRRAGRINREFLNQLWDQLDSATDSPRYCPETRQAMVLYMKSSGVLVTRGDDWILPQFLPVRDAVYDTLVNGAPNSLPGKLTDGRNVSSWSITHESMGMGFGIQLVQWMIRRFRTKFPLFYLGGLVGLQASGSDATEDAKIPLEIRWELAKADAYAGRVLISIGTDQRTALEYFLELREQMQQELLPVGAESIEVSQQGRAGEELAGVQIPLESSEFPPIERGRLSVVPQCGVVGISMKGAPKKDPTSPLEFWPALLQELLLQQSKGKLEVLCYRRDQERQTTTELYHDLTHCDLLICMISPQYLLSEYCMTELLLAARRWSAAPDPGDFWYGDPQQWRPRIPFVLYPPDCADNGRSVTDPNHKSNRTWADDWRNKGTTYVVDAEERHQGEQAARSAGPQENVADPWFRFAKQGSCYPAKLLAAIHDVRLYKHILPQISAEDLKTPQSSAVVASARDALLKFVDQLVADVQKFISSSSEAEQLQRLTRIALRFWSDEQVPEACDAVDRCLQCLPNPIQIAEQIRDGQPDQESQQLLADLLDCQPLMEAWRKRQGSGNS